MGITIKDLYDEIKQMRLDNKQAQDAMIALIYKRDAEFNERLVNLSREIYGEGEQSGIKYQVKVNTGVLASMKQDKSVSEWKQFIITMVASITAAITGASWKN